MNFVRHSQLLATLGAAACQYSATVLGSHSLTETVLVVAATVVRLECSFHILIFVLLFVQCEIRGAKLGLFFQSAKLSVDFSSNPFLFSHFFLTFAPLFITITTKQ